MSERYTTVVYWSAPEQPERKTFNSLQEFDHYLQRLDAMGVEHHE